MTPSEAQSRISPKDLAELEDLTHHLSGFVTAFVYHASLFPPDLPAPLFERTLILTGLATKIETHLIKLMCRLGELGDSPCQPVVGVGTAEQKGVGRVSLAGSLTDTDVKRVGRSRNAKG